MVTSVGPLLRDWRRRHHLSQLDLSVGAEVTARHLSLVETGRSRPSLELLLHLAEHLTIAELAIESFFPADEATAAALRRAAA